MNPTFVPVILVEGRFPQRTARRKNLFASLFLQEWSLEISKQKKSWGFLLVIS